MRQAIIAGNWKMNMTVNEAIHFVDKIMKASEETPDEVVICPPAIHMGALAARTKKSAIRLGAQTMHEQDKGAFTGEISADMLKDYGVSHCIIGHSERRQYYNETDASVNAKVKKAHEKNLIPIICVGETLQEKETGQTKAVITRQIEAAFEGIPASDAADSVVAYEPIWAIGTGRTAAPEDAQETIAAIRDTLRAAYGEDVSDLARILYGGSVKAANIKEIMAQPDIDGVLVGGASLDESHFNKIIRYR